MKKYDKECIDELINDLLDELRTRLSEKKAELEKAYEKVRNTPKFRVNRQLKVLFVPGDDREQRKRDIIELVEQFSFRAVNRALCDSIEEYTGHSWKSIDRNRMHPVVFATASGVERLRLPSETVTRGLAFKIVAEIFGVSPSAIEKTYKRRVKNPPRLGTPMRKKSPD